MLEIQTNASDNFTWKRGFGDKYDIRNLAHAILWSRKYTHRRHEKNVHAYCLLVEELREVPKQRCLVLLENMGNIVDDLVASAAEPSPIQLR